jgi:hypothetical protein
MVDQSAFKLKSRRNESVEVLLMGGIGNQLFCYSAGAYLSEKLHVNLILRRDRLLTTNKTHPGRDISALGLPGQYMRTPILNSNLLLHIFNFPKRVHRLIHKIFKFNSASNRVFYSNKIGADSEFEALSKPVILDGYFQTWKYPRSVQNILLESVINHKPRSDYSRLFIEQIKNVRPIVVHIRRGDFSNPENSYFGILDKDYYARGYAMILEHLGSEVPVWVFSDEPKTAKNFLEDVFPAHTRWVQDDSEIDALESLVAMTYGSAHLIANSTYSWWGAFLSTTTKVVVAPNKWFKMKDDPPEILDPSWKTIESSWLK